MRQVIITSPNIKELFPDDSSIKTFKLEKIPVTCALVDTPDVAFNPKSKENQHRVLVRKRAFSCNYRDKAYILSHALKFKENVGKVGLMPVGSDFVANIVAFGDKVKGFRVGDRVMGDAHYPSDRKDIPVGSQYIGFNVGMPTNIASCGLDIFHYRKLVKVPKQMSDEVAASFMTGGITSYSIIRKLDIQEGDNILVTTKSNTSLFVINALNQVKKVKKIRIYVLSRSHNHEKKLKKMGVDKVLIGNPANSLLFDKQSLKMIAGEKLKFNCIVDSFFDLHFSRIIKFMDYGGRYITCGWYDQFSKITGSISLSKDKGEEFSTAFSQLVYLNAKVIGNCIGLTSDLKKAMNDHVRGKFNIPIDSVFEDSRVAEFLTRTYKAPDRFGKVVYRFADLDKG